MARLLTACAVSVLLPCLAWAQDNAGAPARTAPTRDKEAVTYQEIERGFHLAMGGGAYFLAAAPKVSSNIANDQSGSYPFCSGEAARVDVGYDFGDRVSVDLFLEGTTSRPNGNYQPRKSQAALGDFSALIPGAAVRVNLVGIPDSQDVKRTWLYVKGAAGYTFFQPTSLLPSNDIFLAGAVGLDYFTHLRHFSIGVELGASYLLTAQSLGFSLVPNVRYAF